MDINKVAEIIKDDFWKYRTDRNIDIDVDSGVLVVSYRADYYGINCVEEAYISHDDERIEYLDTDKLEELTILDIPFENKFDYDEYVLSI